MQSFWQHHSVGEFPVPSGHLTCDVAVIGAGYTGSWLAYWLRNTGLDVVVLEAGRPGVGASGRNGGLLLQGPSQLLGQAAVQLGAEDAVALWNQTRQSFQWVAELAERHPIDFHVTGSLYVGGDPTEEPIIELTTELLNQEGIKASMVPVEDQPASIQRLGYDVGLWVPDDAMVHPMKLIGALLQESVQSGVRVYQGATVENILDGADSVDVTGRGFSLTCGAVLVATNCELPGGLDALSSCLHPVRGQMLATEPTDRLDHQYPVYANHGFIYWHQRPDGRIVAGGFRDMDMEGEMGLGLVLNEAIQARLDQLVIDLAGHAVPVSDRWSGIMSMTHDRYPLVGMVTKHVGAAVGYNGHGSTVTPIAARMLKEALLAGSPVFPPFSVHRVVSDIPL